MKESLKNLTPDRRDALLNSAFREFAAKGIEDASTNEIARRADISKALMFHYVGSKMELFRYLCDYALDLFRNEYFGRLDLSERDVLKRLRTTFLAKTELSVKYPWVFDFSRAACRAMSDGLDPDIRARFTALQREDRDSMFGNIDETLFRPGLDIGRCKQLIVWSISCFMEQTAEPLLKAGKYGFSRETLVNELDAYLAELRKALYKE